MVAVAAANAADDRSRVPAGRPRTIRRSRRLKSHVMLVRQTLIDRCSHPILVEAGDAAAAACPKKAHSVCRPVPFNSGRSGKTRWAGDGEVPSSRSLSQRSTRSIASAIACDERKWVRRSPLWQRRDRRARIGTWKRVIPQRPFSSTGASTGPGPSK
jgi:hypothetical protein